MERTFIYNLTSIFTRAGINIDSVQTKDIDSNFTGFDMGIEVTDLNELNKISQKVRSKKFTSSCIRLINEK